jgi:amino acid permease
MIFSVIAMRLNTAVQSALYGATMLQPLAVEGYISPRFNVLNNQNIPVKAAVVNLFVCAGTCFL